LRHGRSSRKFEPDYLGFIGSPPGPAAPIANGRFSFKTERPAVSTLAKRPLLLSVSSTGVGGGGNVVKMDSGSPRFCEGLFDDQQDLPEVRQGSLRLCLSHSCRRRTSDRAYHLAVGGVPALRAVLMGRFVVAAWRRA
jgi:hypothetical protein